MGRQIKTRREIFLLNLKIFFARDPSAKLPSGVLAFFVQSSPGVISSCAGTFSRHVTPPGKFARDNSGSWSKPANSSNGRIPLPNVKPLLSYCKSPSTGSRTTSAGSLKFPGEPYREMVQHEWSHRVRLADEVPLAWQGMKLVRGDTGMGMRGGRRAPANEVAIRQIGRAHV